MFDSVLINGNIVTENRIFKANIGINDGKISSISDNIPEGKKVFDLSGKYILPGMIDGHVHTHDPGFTHREDIEHASMAAAAGGVTTMMIMPLNDPMATDCQSYFYNMNCYENNSYIDYSLYGGATADNLNELKLLWDKTGTTAIKMFMSFSVKEFPFLDDKALFKTLSEIATFDGIALIHAENDGMLSALEEKLVSEGRKDAHAHNEAHPIEAETEAVSRAIKFLEMTGARAVILHVTSAEALKIIMDAKLRGINVYAESCAHLFTFTDEDMNKFGPYLKFTPVMHTAENRRKMWELIGKGYVDTISSDHSPYTRDEKDAGINDIWKAPNGIPGLQTSLPVFLNGVSNGHLTLPQLVKMTSANPAKILGLTNHKNGFAIGSDADITVVDMKLTRTLTENDLFYKCGWSPYVGMSFTGWPIMTFVRGNLVFADNRIVGKKGFGKPIYRNKK